MDLNPRRVALLVAANTALAPFAIDAYLPAMGIIAESIGASIHRTELSISVFCSALRWANSALARFRIAWAESQCF